MKKLFSLMTMITVIIVSLFIFVGCGDKLEKNLTDKGENDEYNIENKLAKEVSIIDRTPVDYKSKEAYYFVVNGEKFTVDDKLLEITNKTDLEQEKSAIETEVSSKNYLISGGYFYNTQKKTVFSVIPINLESENVKIPEATVGGFSFTKYNYESTSDVIEICNGITIGTSMDDVVAIFGEPTEKDMREEYDNLGIKYTYKGGLYKFFEFEFDKETKTVTNITWRYLTFEN